MSVQIGDRIRISAELMKSFLENPDRQSEVVVLKEIREDDGVKILVVSVEGHI